MSRKALGRGLEALIPTRAPETARPQTPAQQAAAVLDQERENTPVELPVDAIQVNAEQPRRNFDEDRLEELAASMRRNGILQPLLVRRKGETFELIAGERRLRAARMLGLETVPVHVREAHDSEMLRLAILENVQREDLNPIEEARAYQRLIDEFDMTQLNVAEQLGKTRQVIHNTLRLLNLPASLQARLESGELTAGHARALLAADSLEEQEHIANLVRDKNLTVREVEQITQGRMPKKAVAKPAKAPALSPELQQLQKRLQDRFGTRVRIRPRKADGSAGRVEIDYYSAADLERMFEIAGVPYLL
jgi:ParB family chromosome partitioning protein